MIIKILNESKKIVVVKLKGDITVENKKELAEKFGNILDEMNRNMQNKIQIDMSEVKYMDSIGIGFFVKFKKDLDRYGINLDFLNVSDVVMRVFSLLSLDKYFDFYNTVEG